MNKSLSLSTLSVPLSIYRKRQIYIYIYMHACIDRRLQANTKTTTSLCMPVSDGRKDGLMNGWVMMGSRSCMSASMTGRIVRSETFPYWRVSPGAGVMQCHPSTADTRAASSDAAFTILQPDWENIQLKRAWTGSQGRESVVPPP